VPEKYKARPLNEQSLPGAVAKEPILKEKLSGNWAEMPKQKERWGRLPGWAGRLVRPLATSAQRSGRHRFSGSGASAV